MAKKIATHATRSKLYDMKTKSFSKSQLRELYRIARALLEPVEEHLNKEYTRALVEMLVDVEGLEMGQKPEVARRLGIPEEYVMEVCR
jgi:hypothetical protein